MRDAEDMRQEIIKIMDDLSIKNDVIDGLRQELITKIKSYESDLSKARQEQDNLLETLDSKNDEIEQLKGEYVQLE